MVMEPRKLQSRHIHRKLTLGLLGAWAFVLFGCAQLPGGGADWFELAGSPPTEVSYLLPKFECNQNPQRSICCSDGPSEEAHACCQVFDSIMEARATSNKIPYDPNGLNDRNNPNYRVFHAPFTDTENQRYTDACGGGVIQGQSFAKLVCSSDQENMVDGKIVAINRKGAAPVHLELIPADSQGSDSQDKTLLLSKAFEGVNTLEVTQVTGGRLVSLGVGADNGKSSSLTLTGPTIVMKRSLQDGGALPTSFSFAAPMPNNPKQGYETYSFVAVAKSLAGQPKWSASGSCDIALQSFGSGQGCHGCSLGTHYPMQDALGNLLATLILLSIPFFARRARPIKEK